MMGKSMFTKEEKKRLKEHKTQNKIVIKIGNKILDDIKESVTGG